MTITAHTPLSALAEQPNGEWWKLEELGKRGDLELPTRVLVALENAGIKTVADLRAAGPHRLHQIDHIGKLGFQQIVNLLQALDRQNGGGSHDHEPGKATLR